MSRRAKLWAIGIASAVVFAVMAVIDRGLKDKAGDGILDLQFAGSTERVREIVAGWGPDGRDDARLSLAIDFGYLALYGWGLFLAARAVADGAASRGWTGLRRAAGYAAPAAIAAALLDAIENGICLIALDGVGDGSPAGPLITGFAALKWAAALGAIAVIVVGAVRLRRAR